MNSRRTICVIIICLACIPWSTIVVQQMRDGDFDVHEPQERATESTWSPKMSKKSRRCFDIKLYTNSRREAQIFKTCSKYELLFISEIIVLERVLSKLNGRFSVHIGLFAWNFHDNKRIGKETNAQNFLKKAYRSSSIIRKKIQKLMLFDFRYLTPIITTYYKAKI